MLVDIKEQSYLLW